MPVDEETKIVPIASGVVTGRVPNDSVSGNFLHVYHGLGFVSLYGHLNEMLVNPTDIVTRNTVIGIMGNTGSGAIGIVHLHLSLYGPFYTEYLKLEHVQYRSKGPRALAPYIIDPEELSILGRHKSLPYSLSEDSKLDAEFNMRVKKARKEVDEFLKLFPNIKKDRFDPYVVSVINKYRNLVDIALDRDIADLYKEVSKENPSIPKQDAERIKKSLEEIMVNAVPRFTAPIKEPGITRF